MLLLIMTLIYILITITLSSIILFKSDYEGTNEEKIVVLFKYLIILIIYIAIIGAGSFIFNNDVKYLAKYCTKACKHYTNDGYKLVIGLLLNVVATFMFYLSTKKTIIKLFNTKSKYLILIIYSIIQYCGLLFGYFSFYKFLGTVVIENLFINIFRYIVIFIPLIIYPTDMIIKKIKEH